MMQIKNINDANRLLANYVPQVRELLGTDITLERMWPLMEVLGSPQNKLKVVHISGTSGKTSTAYYIANLLHQSGQRVGLTVSPHIDSVTERIQINGEPINEAEFCANLAEFIEIIKTVKLKPTYFELLMAFAYWYFAKVGVDYAVIETGLGGLHDASNVASREDKVCVVTDIGFDHMHVLGNTLAEIAEQKAGIIHNGNQVFMYQQSGEINNVFITTARFKKAILNTLSNRTKASRGEELTEFETLPAYQQRNWQLAYNAFSHITERDNLPAISDADLILSMQTEIPGRMETRQVLGKTLIMDGAHNEQKMQSFVSSLKQLFPNKKAAIVLALKEGKEFEKVLPQLLPICSRLIITTFNILQDLPSKSINPLIISEAAKLNGFKDVTVVNDPKEAYAQLVNSPEDLLIITGSFYLLSCIRPSIITNSD